MNTKLLLIVLLFAHPVTHASSNEWTLSQMDEVKIWLHKKNPDITGSLQQIKRKAPLDWSSLDRKNFYQQFEEKKKRTLNLIGVRNWKATDYMFQNKDGVESLTVEGSYMDSRGLEIVFKELHIFKELETVQVLHTRPKKLAAKKTYEEDFFSMVLNKKVNK